MELQSELTDDPSLLDQFKQLVFQNKKANIKVSPVIDINKIIDSMNE